MGQEVSTAVEVSGKASLIDFLYTDKERADSLISQIRNGTLRSVVKTTGASEGFSVSGKAHIPAVLEGDLDKTTTSTTSASEQYDPYHSQLIGLLNDLCIEPLDTLPSSCVGELVTLKSSVLIRDIASMKAMMPTLTKNPSFFLGNADKNTRNTIKVVQDLLQHMPDTISLSLSVGGVPVDGVLKEAGLSIKQSDLIRMYGASIPGEWYILGILDQMEKQGQQPADVASIENAIDAFAMAASQLYSSSQYKIIPILIYREITYFSN